MAPGALAHADPAALAEHRLAATQAHLALGAVDLEEGAVGRLVGEDEVPVATEDARVQPRRVLGGHDDLVARVAADARRRPVLDRDGLTGVGELEDVGPRRPR